MSQPAAGLPTAVVWTCGAAAHPGCTCTGTASWAGKKTAADSLWKDGNVEGERWWISSASRTSPSQTCRDADDLDRSISWEWKSSWWEGFHGELFVVWIFGCSPGWQLIPARVSSPALKTMAGAGALLGDFRIFRNAKETHFSPEGKFPEHAHGQE